MKNKLISSIALVGVTFFSTTHFSHDGEISNDVNKSVPQITDEVINRTIDAKLRIAQRYSDLESQRIHFNPNNVREKSNLTVSHIQEVLQGTSLYPLASYYIELEKKYNINALFVLGLTIEESGWGTSRITHENNNISGQRINGVYRSFKSKYACLKETFRLISEEYIDPNGKYYVGSSNIYDINDTYCPDTARHSWANNIVAITTKIKESI